MYSDRGFVAAAGVAVAVADMPQQQLQRLVITDRFAGQDEILMSTH
jgi:hypothetical protein